MKQYENAAPHNDGLGFEEALRKILGTPPPPLSKSAEKAAIKKPKRKKG